VLFVLNVQNGRATIGGAETSADAIIRLAGADNAASSVAGFKPVVDEALVELQPDAIVTMRRSGGQHDTEQVMSMKGMRATPAGAAGRIVNMDGLYLLGFGPRTASAALDLMRMLYPELGVPSPGTIR
jgi:heme transport system substrate-binding protein